MALLSITFFYIDDSSDHIYIELDENFFEKISTNRYKWITFRKTRERKTSAIYNKEHDVLIVNLKNVTNIKIVEMDEKYQNLVRYKLDLFIE